MTLAKANTVEALLAALSELIQDFKASQDQAVIDIGAFVSTETINVPADVPVFQNSNAAPWDGLVGDGPGVNLAPSAELYAKMQWIGKNVPSGMSMRGLLLVATEEYVAKQIAVHYKQN